MRQDGLLRLAQFGVRNAFAMLRMLAMIERDKDVKLVGWVQLGGSKSCSRCETPASCHSASRRQ